MADAALLDGAGAIPLARGFAVIQKLRRFSMRLDVAALQRDARPARAGLARLVASYQPPMPPGVLILEHPPCGPVRVVEFRPAVPSASKPLLYVHGGGLVFHGLLSFSPTLATLAEDTGRRIVALDYPKVPEVPAAAVMAGLVGALDHLARQCKGRPTLVGDSVGGLVVLWAALSALRDLRPALVLVYPLLDLTERRQFESRDRFGRDLMLDADLLTYFRGLARAALPAGFDPLDLSQADLAVLGPLSVVSAGQDVLADEAALFVARMRACGRAVPHVTLADLPHDFLLYGGRIPEARTGLRRLGRAITEHM